MNRMRVLYLMLWTYTIFGIITGIPMTLLGAATESMYFWSGVIQLSLGVSAAYTLWWWHMDNKYQVPSRLRVSKASRERSNALFLEFQEWKQFIPDYEELEQPERAKYEGRDKVFMEAWMVSKGFQKSTDFEGKQHWVQTKALNSGR